VPCALCLVPQCYWTLIAYCSPLTAFLHKKYHQTFRMGTGIVGYGVYIPKYRIDRKMIGKAWSTGGRGENSVRYHDEDVITMAAEACMNAVYHGAIEASGELDAIYLGTDSYPHIEHSSLGIIGEVLRAKDELDVADFTASPRAAFAALKACRDAVDAGRIGYGLVTGSEARSVSPGSPEEMNCGEGAAAILLGRENTIAEIEGGYTYASNIVDRWREMDALFSKEYEPRFTRNYGYLQHITKAKDGILRKLQAQIDDFQHVVLQQPDARMVKKAAKVCKIPPEKLAKGDHFGAIGDLGAASVLMGLASVLERLHRDPELRRSMAAKGRERVLAMFGLDRMVRDTEAFFRSLVRGQ